MAHVLYIEGSPRKVRSASIEVAHAALAAWRMAYDFQRPYLELWLRLIGITDITTVTVEKTLFGPEVDSVARKRAQAEAADAARRCVDLLAKKAVLRAPPAAGALAGNAQGRACA